MIRYSTPKDINGIIHLWNEAFGDSVEDIRFFLDACYKPENTLVCETDNKIASMLFLLEGDMSVDGTDYPSYYLYAACTLKEYRGRGFMAKLLDFARSTAEERNKFFICLKPGEKSLFDFYEKHGYEPVFTIKKAVFDIDYTAEKYFAACSETVVDRELLRNNAFSGQAYFKWDKQSINFAFLHNKRFGGFVSEGCKGYSLYTFDGSITTVKETTFTNKKELIHSLPSDVLKKTNCISVNFSSHVDAEGETNPFAMLLAVDEKAKLVAKQITNGYLGLTLE